ncbi:MAG: hypothetical protein J1G01_03905 [Clostridiales bacterium]|nr:hypothetical protein [Clostridiales bacterium]
MKDKQARALAIVALVFMGIFIAALTATLVDYTLLNGSIGYIALGTGVFVFMIFIALKADGRGYSITEMNNEIEMKKIEEALEEQQRREAQEKADGKSDGEKDESESSDDEHDGESPDGKEDEPIEN